MRIALLVALFSLPAGVWANDQAATAGGRIALETFDGYQPLAFPGQWQVRGDKETARTIYQIVGEGGNQFLHARADKQGIQIGLEHSFKPQKFPLLRWRWRVEQLPPGADERAVKTNDSAAAVYVIFDSKVLPRAIKYVWSSTVPVGTRLDSPVYWRAKVVVLQSGPATASEWKQETVNLYQDYKELFGGEPGEAQGIAVLTDSDTTASVAEADYDDFTLVSADALGGERTDSPTAQLSLTVIGGQ
jgi:hypothetical protein